MKKILFFVIVIFSGSVGAETFYEISAGGSELALDITRKRGEDFADDGSALNLAIGAYRQSSSKTAWGAVIELTSPIGREDDLPGNGRILGLRPLNFFWYVGNKLSIEAYAGAAQYEWRKTANGYYFGTSIRYEWRSTVGLGLDLKYYQDLAFDSPEGDDIVDGFNTGVKLFYRFK